MRFYRLILFLFPMLFACSTTSDYETVYPYEISPDIQTTPVKRVIIATVNLGKPSRLYLQPHESRIDRQLAQYLQANNIQVAPSGDFASRWEKATQTYGEVYDPSTDRINPQSFQLVHATVLKSLQEETDIDAVIYTDLLDRTVMFSGSRHLARWDGVSRRLSIRGAGDSIPMDFNWAQNVDAVSLMVTVYRLSDFSKIFTSVGGLDVTDALSTRSPPRFVRNRSILAIDINIQEGIKLALHPWIVMKDYPGEKR